MRKLLLMGLLIATFWIPIAAARNPNPREGLRKVRKWWAWFCAAWIFAILYIIPRI